MLRQGELDKNSVDGVIIVQLENLLKQLSLGDFSREVDQVTVDAGLWSGQVSSMYESNIQDVSGSAYLTGGLKFHANISSL